jgi:hypothetical protein
LKEEEKIMNKKFRKILVVLLSALMVFTYMPTMAFAAYGDPDEVTCVVTVDGNQVTKSNIAEAYAAATDGSTITVTGTVNNSYAIPSGKDNLTLDFSGATLTEGVEITASSSSACLNVSGKVYSYHDEHVYTSATAVEYAGDPTYAIFTAYCKNGDTLLSEPIEGSVESETTTTITYYAYFKGFRGTWTVDKSAATDTYALGAVDYVKAGDGLAILGSDGKPQFYAFYKKNGIDALDDNGNKIKLQGTIKSKANVVAPTIDSYGTADYTVEFTLPNNEKVERTLEGVKDADKTTAEKNTIKGIQLQLTDEEGKTSWGETITAATANAPEDALAADGKVTYRLVYAPTEGENEMYDDAQVMAPKKTTAQPCGHTVYEYDQISQRYTDVSGNIATYTFKLNNATVEGKHEYATRSTWAAKFQQTTPATHTTYGVADVECQFCDYADDAYQIPKLANHTFEQENGADKVYTVAATCNQYGFQYKKCTVSDGGWVDGEYVLKDGKKVLYTFTNDADTWHPVLVEGSVKDKVDHKYFVKANTIVWNAPATATSADDITCSLDKMCQVCLLDGHYIYHKLTFAEAKKLDQYAEFELDEGSTDTVTTELAIHVFGAIAAKATAGADCSKYDSFTYTVNGVVDASGSAITTTVESTVLTGPHTYSNAVTFSADGKTATVLQQCTNSKCLHKEDADGNKDVQTKDATVTSVDNADGSTTYTATLEGTTLTNNTKTVFDLTKATVTINDGKELDINSLKYDYAGTEFAKLVEVKINGATIDSKLYIVEISGPVEDALVPGTNNITVYPAEGSNAVGSAKGVVKCVKPGQLFATDLKFDGKPVYDSTYSAYANAEYDGKAHTVEAAVMDYDSEVPVTGAAIKYAVVKYADFSKLMEKVDSYQSWQAALATLTYTDKAEMTDAADYMVVAQLSAEGYTTVYDTLVEVEITPKETGATITTKTQYMVYGDTNFVATTGDEALDKEIGLSTADASKLGVGSYSLRELVTYDPNYDVDISGYVHIEKRNAKIVMTDTSVKYNGKPVDLTSLFTIDGLVNDDDLNIIVNTVGDIKDPTDAGKYELVATANNANYNIEEVRATLTITKLASKVKKVSPLKKSLKAGKSFNLKATKVGDGKVTFKKASGNKKITVNKTGKVVVKKGLKAGKYSVKVKVTVAASKNYKKAAATKTIKITVK